MNRLAIDSLCKRVVALMADIDQISSSLEYLEELDNPVDVLAGAMFAKGYLDGTISISEETVPFIESSENQLINILASLEDAEEDE